MKSMYILIHNHYINNEGDQKFIGIYDEIEKAEKVREEYKEIEGFSEQPDNFKILDVAILDNALNKEMPIVYILETYDWDEENMEEENVKYEGVFYSESNANEYVSKNKDELYVNGRKAEINKAWVNRNEWSEGFFTYVHKTKIKKIILLILAAIIIVPYLFVETNTFLFGEKFDKSYEQTGMISDVEYYKVFYYTGETAKVYYVDGGVRAGHFIWLKKKKDEWKLEKWETVWSEQGSASGITFPFYR